MNNVTIELNYLNNLLLGIFVGLAFITRFYYVIGPRTPSRFTEAFEGFINMSAGAFMFYVCLRVIYYFKTM